MTATDNGAPGEARTFDLEANAGKIRHVKNGYIVPPMATERPSRWAPSGVLDENGVMVDESISWSSTIERVNGVPEKPVEAKRLAGKYIFGGILYGHFGHFIVESLGRMWALDAVDAEVDGYIFTPKSITFAEKSVLKQQGLAELLGMRLPFVVAREPLQVDELYVPSQGFGASDLIEGTQAFRDFINAHAGAKIEPFGGEKLYISRSQLPRDRGSILGEYRLEEYLREEGYEIFHPQRAPAEEQIARYKAAKLIIGVDCSPIHMVGYVGNSDQNTAIILRRSLPIGGILTQQLRAFKGMKVADFDCLIDDWIPMPGHRPSRSSWGEVDFGKLHASLLESGHISGTTPWPSLTEEERAAELARVEKMHEASFASMKGLAARRAPAKPPATATPPAS